MYKDRMVHKVGDMVKVIELSHVDARKAKVPEHRIGLIVACDNTNRQFYDVKFGQYIGKFHYSFLRPLSTKNCQGGTK